MSSSGDGGGLTSFINWSSEDTVSTGNPVNWGPLASTIVTSVVTGFVLGITSVVNAIAATVVNILGGFETFLTGVDYVEVGVGGTSADTSGLIDVTIGALVTGYEGLYAFNVEQFGVLALPVTVVIVLAVLYVLVRGGREIVQTLVGAG